jgi:hypothetical protein
MYLFGAVNSYEFCPPFLDTGIKMAWRRGLVISSPPATEETGAMGSEIESRQGIHSG